MKSLRNIALLSAIALTTACSSPEKKVPVVGFIEAFEDATVGQARTGFTDALKKGGYSEDSKTIKIEYRNAQGNIPNLVQIANYYVNQPVNLLATSTTLSTLTASQKTSTIPIFAMVSPTPERMKVLNGQGKAPANLFGAVEDLQYIDTSFALIPQLLKPQMGRLKVGVIYNQSEPQSTDALDLIKARAAGLNVDVIAMPVNTSADAQLVTKALLDKTIDAFFALPDNTVFASFETIVKSCDEKFVPIFSSEAGLVQRGAVAAFGADMYQWGYQAGEQAAQYLKTGKTDGLKPEMVKIRKRVYNPTAAAKYHITVPTSFTAVK
ncbi:ABC transporter substrate-binding protein [Mucilaginibacter myungsuensis]|uniref:ABC transporter substrate-binding protein n=1 Tax=Mucilaginibacter myungsuensis TaxID=649104 RepID=A0A929PX54_9SPHI|nr:ABC transporter substrate-binding protein [Mucilaginibacter myungsuensis]MBE9662811.1 ABC transporter substrate-binding protein [Mucilaginibacter myungsuensis]MDN3598231.1 ABC transporter substrate-binding protein [Mucilaginibacter myungsuensis]